MTKIFEDVSIAEIVSKTKHLEIKARKMVNSSLQSDYKSSFKGRGMEFDQVRSYTPGDNVRDIDWNVTARMNEPFVKTFIEERELQVYFIADISASSTFGSIKSKRQIMAEIIALLGFTSFFSNDKAGLILTSDDIEKIIPPMHNYSHILRMIRDVFYFPPQSDQTNLNIVLKKINSLIKKKAVIFLLSDFFDTDYEKSLGSLAKKHEVIPIVVTDPLEYNLAGSSSLPVIVELEDMESGQTNFKMLARGSSAEYDSFNIYYQKIFKKLGLEYTEINAHSDLVKIIDRLLKKHATRY